MTTTPDESEIEALVQRIDDAAQAASTAFKFDRVLGATAEDRGTPLGVIAAAFLYRERGPRDDRSVPVFRPFIEGEAGSAYPPPPQEMPVEVLGVWEACAQRVTAPMARARLHDLLFTARSGNVGDHARAAVAAYVELAARYPRAAAEEMERIHVGLGAGSAIRRALELARAMRDDDLAQQVMREGVLHARHALSTKAGPGIVFGFLRPIAEDRDSLPEFDELLLEARREYAGDVWQTASAIELQLARTGDAPTKEQLHRDEVQALIDAADQEASPLNAMLHLQKAVQLAERHHLSDLRDGATKKLQDLAGADLGLVRHGVSVPVDRALIDAWIDQLIDCETWQEAFERLLAQGPPSGRVEENHKFVEDIPRISPLVDIMPTMLLTGEGLPKITAETPEERSAHHLADVELRRIQMVTPFIVEVLERIHRKWGPIDAADLRAFFGRAVHVTDPVAGALARAVGRYFNGDFEGAAFTAVARIERLAREVLLQLGAPVFKVAVRDAPAQYPGLGSLLDRLEARGLDESWARFLGTFFTRPEGPGYRNELLHGSIDDVGQGAAAIVVIAVLFMTIGISVEPPPASDEPGSAAAE